MSRAMRPTVFQLMVANILPQKKLIWNLKMKVWKMTFPFKGVIFQVPGKFSGGSTSSIKVK